VNSSRNTLHQKQAILVFVPREMNSNRRKQFANQSFYQPFDSLLEFAGHRTECQVLVAAVFLQNGNIGKHIQHEKKRNQARSYTFPIQLPI